MKTVMLRNVEVGVGVPKVIVPIVGKTREEILAKAEEQVAAFSSARFLLGLLRIPDLMKPEEIAVYKARACALYDKGLEPLCF